VPSFLLSKVGCSSENPCARKTTHTDCKPVHVDDVVMVMMMRMVMMVVVIVTVIMMI
jgi:hypothetical protein